MEPANQKIKEYAGGWMTERAGTEVPGFLKLAFAVIALGCLAYVVLYMYGETGHAGRGRLVEELNAATSTPGGIMYLTLGLMAAFTVIVVWFALRRNRE